MGVQRDGHGWGAYFWPYVSFLGIIELSRRFPDDYQPGFLLLKVAVPLGLLVWYFRRGAYPELRGHRWSWLGAAQDVAIGVLGAAIWMAPFIISDSLRPDSEGAFDPNQFGPSLAWFTLLVRAIGYGVATPFIEELFVRSWLHRYVEVFDQRRDFRDVPIGHYTRRSLAVVVVWFTVSHVPWEWPVAFAWILLTQLWFYHTRSLVSMVVVHATSNLSILAFVIAFSGWFTDGQGQPIALWFFV
jgi:CAAX prenyl protease-like protein